MNPTGMPSASSVVASRFAADIAADANATSPNAYCADTTEDLMSTTDCPTCGDDGACYVCFDADEPTDTEPEYPRDFPNTPDRMEDLL